MKVKLAKNLREKSPEKATDTKIVMFLSFKNSSSEKGWQQNIS